jgi:hypothetical protein
VRFLRAGADAGAVAAGVAPFVTQAGGVLSLRGRPRRLTAFPPVRIERAWDKREISACKAAAIAWVSIARNHNTSLLSPSATFVRLHVLYLMDVKPQKQPPRLVKGKCPNCPSTEIVVKEIKLDGKSYKGYCLNCGVDVISVLVTRKTSGLVFKDGDV